MAYCTYCEHAVGTFCGEIVGRLGNSVCMLWGYCGHTGHTVGALFRRPKGNIVGMLWVLLAYCGGRVGILWQTYRFIHSVEILWGQFPSGMPIVSPQ